MYGDAHFTPHLEHYIIHSCAKHFESPRDSAKVCLRHALLSNLAVLEKHLKVTRANTTDGELKISFDTISLAHFVRIPLDQFVSQSSALGVYWQPSFLISIKAPKAPVDFQQDVMQ